MKMSRHTEPFGSSKKDGVVQFTLREIGVGYVQRRWQRRVVARVDRSDGRDVGGSVAVLVQSNGSDVVGGTINERCAAAVLANFNRGEAGAGRDGGGLAADVAKVRSEDKHMMFHDGGIAWAPRDVHRSTRISGNVNGREVREEGFGNGIRNINGQRRRQITCHTKAMHALNPVGPGLPWLDGGIDGVVR